MRRTINIFFLFLAISTAVLPYKVEAIDPVTIAILAPVAIKAAEAARPYVIRGMINFAKGLFKVFKSAFGIIYLPYGLLKMMFGWPFGALRSGLVNTVKGLIAPFKMLFHVLMLPLYTVGLEINTNA